jgi:hypothetical protein
MKELRMKVKMMRVKGRRGWLALMDSNLPFSFYLFLKFSPVPRSKLQLFSPCPSMVSHPVFEVSTSWFSTNFGENILSKIQQEKNLKKKKKKKKECSLLSSMSYVSNASRPDLWSGQTGRPTTWRSQHGSSLCFILGQC